MEEKVLAAEKVFPLFCRHTLSLSRRHLDTGGGKRVDKVMPAPTGVNRVLNGNKTHGVSDVQVSRRPRPNGVNRVLNGHKKHGVRRVQVSRRPRPRPKGVNRVLNGHKGGHGVRRVKVGRPTPRPRPRPLPRTTP